MPKIQPDTTVDEAVDYCRNQAPDKDDHYIICWSVEDVKDEAKEKGLKITREQARDVLRYFADHYDYVWEVSWNLMSESIKESLRKE